MKKSIKVVFDSSFLLVPSQFRLDIFEELEKVLNRRFEPVILSVTREELEKIAQQGSPKLSKQAALALELAQRCKQIEVDRKKGEPHDFVIVRVAAELGYYVATNDKLLRKRLRKMNIPVVFMRQKMRLALDGGAY